MWGKAVDDSFGPRIRGPQLLMTNFCLLWENSNKLQIREVQTSWATESPGKILAICQD